MDFMYSCDWVCIQVKDGEMFANGLYNVYQNCMDVLCTTNITVIQSTCLSRCDIKHILLMFVVTTKNANIK